MILRTRHGNVQARVWDGPKGLADMIRASGGSTRSGAGALVSGREVAGVPAWQQGIRIAAWSIARHEMAVWRGRGVGLRRVTSTWQARKFEAMPNERDSWFYIWECTEASLTARNNAIWYRTWNDSDELDSVWVIHPDSVAAKVDHATGEVSYVVRGPQGQWSKPLTSREILHFRVGAPDPGAVWAPSPVELHRRALGSVLARAGAEENLYASGAMKSVAVVFPGDVEPEQAREWKDVYLGPGGIQSDDRVKVFGGDPRIETIGLSLQDAQYVEAQGFSVFDVGRILGVPPSLLWGAVQGGDKPLSPEHEEDRWIRHGLAARRMRIEETLRADRYVFGPGSRDYPKFIPPIVAGDRATEAQRGIGLVQAGIAVPDTIAAELGYPPLPDGLGQIPQITPVGGAPNEAAAPPPAS